MKIKRRAGVSHILQAIESMIEFQFFATITLLLLVAFYAVVDYRAVDSGNRIYRPMGIENEDAGGFLKEMNSENEDIVAWLVLNDTEVDYPVLKGKDNNYYLSHDYEGNYLVAGSIFMDYRNDINDDYLIIYGHHMDNGRMFGSLAKYRDEAYLAEHRSGTLFTLDKNYDLEVIGFTTVSKTEGIYDLENSSNDIVDYFSRSAIDSDIFEHWNGERVVVLSTCNSNRGYRDVVLAKIIE